MENKGKQEGKIKEANQDLRKYAKYTLTDDEVLYKEEKEPSLDIGDEGEFEYHITIWKLKSKEKIVKIIDKFTKKATPEPQKTLTNYMVQEIKNEDSIEIIETIEEITGKTSERKTSKTTKGVKAHGDLLDIESIREKLKNAKTLYKEFRVGDEK